MPRLLPALSAALLLSPVPAPAQDTPITPGPGPTAAPAATPPPAAGGAAPPAVSSPAAASPGAPPAITGRPTPAQQAVLERIRRLRDGDQRRFGSCSYRWDRWKLQSDGSRTTTYSCDGTQIVNHTIGVNCSKLQINSYTPASNASANAAASPKTDTKADANSTAERGSWGSWRLPQPGGEEQMVATLCANALPAPAKPAAAAAVGAGPPRTGAAPSPGSATGRGGSR